MNFKVGQKVVCIKSSNNITIVNNIYTIDGFDACKCGAIGLFLKEINDYEFNRYKCSNCGCVEYAYTKTSFNYKNFRPLQYDIISNTEIIKEIIEEKADIEIKQPQKV